MNGYQVLQSLKILSCFNDIEKGGEGSGRHKNLIQQLEESNFSPDLEAYHRKLADEIASEPEKNKKKLYTELTRLEVDINATYKQAISFDNKRLALAHQGQQHTQLYHQTVGVIKKLVKRRNELIKTFREKEAQFHAIND